MARYAKPMGGREGARTVKKTVDPKKARDQNRADLGLSDDDYGLLDRADDRLLQSAGFKRGSDGLYTSLNRPKAIPDSEKKPSERWLNQYKSDYQKSELDREDAGLPAPVAAPARRVDLDEDGDGNGGMMNFERELRRRRKKTRTKFAGETGAGGYGGSTQLG